MEVLYQASLILNMPNQKFKIVLIGSGNVASHLGNAFSLERSCPIIQVYSRTKSHARSLASKLNCPDTDNISEVTKKADLYLVCVKDDSIEETVNNLSKILPQDSLVAHTSGSAPLTWIERHFSRAGVFYPVQTFSTKKKLKYSEIPFLITSNNVNDTILLKKLASRISNTIYVVQEESRPWIHLAAVFANNFSNALFHIAEQILKKEKLNIDILIPLIRETTEKIKTMSPEAAQTGPARRHDHKTIDKHLTLLKSTGHEDWGKLYRVLSRLIEDMY